MTSQQAAAARDQLVAPQTSAVQLQMSSALATLQQLRPTASASRLHHMQQLVPAAMLQSLRCGSLLTPCLIATHAH